MPTLNPNGNPVRVGQIILRTPGLQGMANSHSAGSPGMRSAEQSSDALEQALRSQNVQPQETIEITGAREIPMASIPTRGTTFDEPAIVAEVPEPGDAFGQLVIYTDESGVTTWNFPSNQDNHVDVTRGSGKLTYVIPRTVPPTEGALETRSLLGAVGKKVLKVVVFPLIDPILGKIGDYFVGRWEQKNRKSRIRPFTPENYCIPDAPSLDKDSWASLGAGRALMMVHGTFSSTHAAFSQLPRDYVRDLCQKYSGRVFAFDHLTLSQNPKANVEWLLKEIPPDIALDLDIVCHSRGGLVSRALAEREITANHSPVRVRNIVFVGAPNAGTILVDAKYMSTFLDSYTNILNLFGGMLPETGVVEALEGIITVAKQLSVDTIKGLDGLQAMRPNGQFLTALNQGQKDDKQYFSISSNFEPKQNPGLKVYIANRLMGKIFQTDNDMVVPTASGYEENGSDFFPIDARYLFSASDAVHHCNYFAQKTTRDKIVTWLS
jgi:pimeloyl-ACP methyl ester carboxylesterase